MSVTLLPKSQFHFDTLSVPEEICKGFDGQDGLPVILNDAIGLLLIMGITVVTVSGLQPVVSVARCFTEIGPALAAYL